MSKEFFEKDVIHCMLLAQRYEDAQLSHMNYDIPNKLESPAHPVQGGKSLG